jgi:hypothetical protein
MSIRNHKIYIYEIWCTYRWGCFKWAFTEISKMSESVAINKASDQIQRTFFYTYTNFHERISFG